MRQFSDRLPLLGRAAIAAAVAVSLGACGSDSNDGDGGPAPMYAVLSAFPAELQPLVEQADIEETIPLDDGRVLRVGTLGGVRVVLGMTGIGLVNAELTTRLVVERFDVEGVIVSGVAGSVLQIGDVAVPMEWELISDGSTYAPPRPWLQLVERIVASGNVTLERCTVPVSRPSAGEVCMPAQPAIVVGGLGQSSDPYDGRAQMCRDDGGDVFGCDVDSGATAALAVATDVPPAHGTVEPEPPYVVDMETAAIARAANAHGVPFIAFRAVSDGAGDPLMLSGGFGQFFAYYRFAADNAATAAIAFLERVTPR